MSGMSTPNPSNLTTSTGYWPLAWESIYASTDPMAAFVRAYVSNASDESCFRVVDDVGLFCPAECKNPQTVFATFLTRDQDSAIWSSLLYPSVINEAVNNTAALQERVGSDISTFIRDLGQQPLSTGTQITDTVVNCLDASCNLLSGCAEISACSRSVLVPNNISLSLSALPPCVAAICTAPQGFATDADIIGIGVWISILIQIVGMILGTIYIIYYRIDKDDTQDQEEKESQQSGLFIVMRIGVAQTFLLYTLLTAGNLQIHTSTTPTFERVALVIAVTIQVGLTLVNGLVIVWLKLWREDEGKSCLLLAVPAVGANLIFLLYTLSFADNLNGDLLVYRSSDLDRAWPEVCNQQSLHVLCDNFDTQTSNFRVVEILCVAAGIVIFILLFAVALWKFFEERRKAAEKAKQTASRENAGRGASQEHGRWHAFIKYINRYAFIRFARRYALEFFLIMGIIAVAAYSGYAYIKLSRQDLVSTDYNFSQIAAIAVWPLAFLDALFSWAITEYRGNKKTERSDSGNAENNESDSQQAQNYGSTSLQSLNRNDYEYTRMA